MDPWEKVFKTCSWKCVYCGARLADDFRLYQSSCEDHLVPKTKTKQGLDGEENLVAACHTCNSFKRDWTPSSSSLIKTDGNGKRFVEKENQPKYIIEVIDHIIDKAKKHRDDHLQNVPAVSQDSFRKSADEYIAALEKRKK
jgi:hypothetical protein